MKKLIGSVLFLLCGALVNAQTVTLDYYFNNEYKKNAAGEMVRYHYTWEDKASSGFSAWGDIFRKNGAQLKSLATSPTEYRLKGTDIYIIADPDTKKETAHPHFISEAAIRHIADWVKAGGVLVLMANDSANVELLHFNKLAAKFGMRFTDTLRNKVTGNQFDMGAFYPAAGDPLFITARKIYMKEIATISLSDNAKPLLTDKGEVIIATTRYGKGTVFAVGDPWLYNEYCNGRLTADFDNDKAADDIAKWLIAQIPVKKMIKQ